MIEKPMFFEEALRFLLEKDPNPEEWDAADWAAEKPAVRVRSLFSSRVESARFLDRAQGLIFDYLAKVRDEVTTPDGERTTALRVGGREDFVMLMRRFMIEEGMALPEEFKDVVQSDLEDIRSVSRLKLIFDTNVRQAYGYGQWRQGMKPAVRRAFPAARFVRVRSVMEPRPRHAAHEGEVRMKTDLDWWAKYQNDPNIGGFGVPWGPYGFHSGMGQEDVPREEADRLGFDTAGGEMRANNLPGMNEGLSASTRGMAAETKRKLLEELRGWPEPRSPEEAAREAAGRARRAGLERRGLTPPPATGQAVEEADDQIRLLGNKASGEALPPPRMTDLNQPEIPGPGGAPIDIPDDLYQRIRADLEDEGGAGGGFEPLEGLSEAAKLAVRSFEASIRALPREHLRIFSPDGIERYRRTGDASSVGLDLSTLPGNVATHNHPGGMPPSLRDVIVGLEGDAMEIRVVTTAFDYAFRFADASQGDIVMHWSSAQQASIAVAREWMRSNPEIGEDEAYARGYHAGFMELARRGILKYVRTANV